MTSTLIPYLTVGDAQAALAFYATAFGADVRDIWRGPDGRVGFADVRVGGARWFVSDAFPELDLVAPAADGPATVSFVLTTEDVDAMAARAAEAGATVLTEPADQGDGARRARLRDPFGHRWIVSTPG
jgi:PhnB protein